MPLPRNLLWTAEVQIDGVDLVLDEFPRCDNNIRIISTKLQTKGAGCESKQNKLSHEKATAMIGLSNDETQESHDNRDPTGGSKFAWRAAVKDAPVR